MAGFAQPYIQTIDGCLADAIGPMGLNRPAVDNRLAALSPKCAEIAGAITARTTELFTIVDETADLDAAGAAFATLTEGAANLIFLGTGGSSLGGQMLAQLGGWTIPGDNRSLNRPRVRFYDNLDPRSFALGLASLDLAKTRFVVTSKSGGTAETLAQAIAVLGALREAGLEHQAGRLILSISEPDPAGKNALRALLAPYGVAFLPHPTGIGGRFSALTVVGLLPAIARGLDAKKVRAGAKLVLDQVVANAGNPGQIPSALGAAIAMGLAQDNAVRTSYLMAYSDQLERFVAWYAQLWAESLGKAGHGTVPVPALGPVDQHSQLQLLMDGPPEVVITLLTTARAGQGAVLAPDLAHRAGADYLAGRAIGDLVAAQQEAIAKALIGAGRPVRVIHAPTLDETAMGALIMHFFLETIFSAALLGIDPFDQPAVEIGKVLTRAALAAPAPA